MSKSEFDVAKNGHADLSYDATRYNKRLMNNVVRLPLEMGQGHQSTLMDIQNGQPLLDYWGDEGVASLGYNTPEVLEAVQDFIRTGYPHRLPDVYPHKVRWECAEIICDRTGMDRIFFACTGTEANEAAIKLARKFMWDNEGPGRDKYTPKRHVILTVAGNFHGRTGLSMASGDFRVSPYHRHGFGPGAKGFGVITDDTFQQVVTNAEEHEAREPQWDEVAAVILAPVLGNNCVKTYPESFWRKLDELRAQHGFLLIYDDVQAGNGRAGNYATHQGVGVKPDIMSLAKGMAMGWPMSVMLAREEVAASFTPGVHFNTFGGTLFVCYLATRFYQWLDLHLPEVRAKGAMIRARWAETPWLTYDGMGMLNAFRPNFEANGYNGFEFIHEARKHGLSLCTHRAMGPIRFTPPLNTPVSELEMAMNILDRTHERLAK